MRLACVCRSVRPSEIGVPLKRRMTDTMPTTYTVTAVGLLLIAPGGDGRRSKCGLQSTTIADYWLPVTLSEFEGPFCCYEWQNASRGPSASAELLVYDMKETLAESAPPYSTVAKWHAEITQGQSRTGCHPKCSNYFTIHHAPSDYYLLPKLKEFMKWQKFVDDEDIISTANGWLEEHHQQLFYNGIRLWRNAGPSAFRLHEMMLKSVKIWYSYLIVNYAIIRTFWTSSYWWKLLCVYVGARRFSGNIEEMVGRPICIWWLISWKFISPAFIVVSYSRSHRNYRKPKQSYRQSTCRPTPPLSSESIHAEGLLCTVYVYEVWCW